MSVRHFATHARIQRVSTPVKLYSDSRLGTQRLVQASSALLRCAVPRLAPACVFAKLGTRGFGNLNAGASPTSTSTSTSTPSQPATMASSPTSAPTPTTSAPSAAAKLSALRAAMAAADCGRGVAAYLVPTEDPHMSEYPPACHKYREFISGFTGTAGTAVVTGDAALLWTDGRYFLQAATELSPEWTLMKAGTPGCPDLEDWLAANLPEGARVGIDPWVHTVNSVRTLQRKLQDAGKVLVPLLDDGNLVAGVWGAAQPPAPPAPLRVHPLTWAGEDVRSKLGRMREQMRAAGASALLAPSLDEVAWLTNTRGADVEHNPVALSYMVVRQTPPPTTTQQQQGQGQEAAAGGGGGEGEGATLYMEAAKLVPQVAEQLEAAGVQVRPYSALLADVAALAAAGERLWLDPARVSYAVYQAAAKAAAGSGADASEGPRKRPRLDTETATPPAEADAATAACNGDGAATAAAPAAAPKPFKPVELPSPITAAKAIKNAAELAGMREAHLRDAVAVCRFMMWLEQQMSQGVSVTEVEVDTALTGFRAQQPGFVETSFSTIAGAGPNGAIIHYRAQPGTCRSVDGSTLLLLDSGGQYECGTTDITRTVHTGLPSEHQRRCFTRVLQGHIALDSAIWPEGTPGAALDTLARTALWREGLNYRHGTGHGVGAALCVHEGPQSISSRYHVTTPLAAGMVCSNEPGYYEDGSFGVRIENLVVVRERDTPFRYAGQQYLGFERLTMVPLQAKLMDLSLLGPSEVEWVDAYHREIWDNVAPRMQDQPELLEWLRRNTRPLREQQQQ